MPEFVLNREARAPFLPFITNRLPAYEQSGLREELEYEAA